MFDSLSDRLNATFKKFSGRGRLDEKNIQEGLREVRLALLEADVNFKVVKDFVERVRERAMGQDVLQSLTPGQQVVKIVSDEMTELLGGEAEGLNLRGKPAVIMLVGLQGSGKTTTAAKLALHFRRNKMNPYLVPADVYRPAAIDQLHTLAKQIDIPAHPTAADSDPVQIAAEAVEAARENGRGVVIVDTAGRLHVDEKLMTELANIKEKVGPSEILFVADAMTGQDAVTVAQSFDERLDVSGVVLTKMEGDARGGAALSIKAVTGKPIKFVGVGEKLSDIEVFHPDRVVSRILGMGDMMTLIEKAQQDVDESEAEELGKKMQRAEFDFEDFRKQMRRLKKIGSLEGIMKMIPGMGKIKDKMGEMNVSDKDMGRLEAMISSMTMEERRNPDIINPSRKKRIAAGSGVDISEVNGLVKNFEQMRKMMKRMMGKGGKMPKGMPNLGGGGGMPGLPGGGGMPGGMPGMEGMSGMSGAGSGTRKATKSNKKKRKKKKRNKKKK